MPIESFMRKREEFNRTILPPLSAGTPIKKNHRGGRQSVNMSARAPLMPKDMDHFMNNLDMRMFIEAYNNAAQTPSTSGRVDFF